MVQVLHCLGVNCYFLIIYFILFKKHLCHTLNRDECGKRNKQPCENSIITELSYNTRYDKMSICLQFLFAEICFISVGTYIIFMKETSPICHGRFSRENPADRMPWKQLDTSFKY